MKITIAERLHPFSHQAGSHCMLPRSDWEAHIFPTHLRFHSFLLPHVHLQVSLNVKGPLENFTVEMDLERGLVRVFGKGPEGFLRYTVSAHKEGIEISFEKLPEKEIECHVMGREMKRREKQTLLLAMQETCALMPLSEERLSLGMHKAQDFDLIRRRKDLKEIFPIWMRLGQMTLGDEELLPIGTMRLLLCCQELIEKKERTSILSHFAQVFQAAFSGMLVPRLSDEEHQGILPFEETLNPETSPLPLLTQGGALIRSLFFRESQDGWEFLPCLPPDFHAGRFTGITTEHQEVISFEWSKHRLKKVLIYTQEARQVLLQFPQHVASFRLRASLKERGRVYAVRAGSVELELKEDRILYLDQFKK